MKYSKELTEQIASWVRQNGVFPQKGGCTQRELCQQFGIDCDTFAGWMKKSDFSDTIKKANEYFARHTTKDVYNALKKKATGYEYTAYEEEQGLKRRKTTTYDPATGKRLAIVEEDGDKMVVKKATRRTVNVAPDTAAAIFLLTNLDPENWKNRRDNTTTLKGEDMGLLIRFGDEAGAGTDAE